MIKLKLLLVFSLILIVNLSCKFHFQLIKSDRQIKGSSIAVLSGLRNKNNFTFAFFLGKYLSENSRFKVISQKEILSKLKKYPYDIRGPYKGSFFKMRKDFNNSDFNEIKRIQKILQVDYIYIAWSIYSIIFTRTKVVAQLFSFPSCVEMGRDKYEISYGNEEDPFSNYMGPRNFHEAVKLNTHELFREIVEKTGMEK